jgi:hypothetical protein
MNPWCSRCPSTVISIQSNMATAHQIQLTASVRGFVNTYEKLSPQSADTTNALLMENHERHHVYFDEAGLHSK